jgi:hypothetical protein
MKKFMPDRAKKQTNELENTITELFYLIQSEDGVARLGNILRDTSYGMLSEKTLKAITKLYDKVDFKETAQ